MQDLLVIELPNGLSRWLQVENVLIDVKKQELTLKVNYILRTTLLGEFIKIEDTQTISRKNIDETPIENSLWLSITSLVSEYLNTLKLGVSL